jgi:hypothetical protein
MRRVAPRDRAARSTWPLSATREFVGILKRLDADYPSATAIDVASKADREQRILALLDDINRGLVVHTWPYRITLPAR